MISLKPHDEPLFTMVSVYSLLGVVALLAVAHFSGKALLPAKTRKFDQAVFIWLVCRPSSRSLYIMLILPLARSLMLSSTCACFVCGARYPKAVMPEVLHIHKKLSWILRDTAFSKELSYTTVCSARLSSRA